MSTGSSVGEANTKMPRSNSLVGTLKRLFKTPSRTDGGSRVAPRGSLDASFRSPRFAGTDPDTSSNNSLTSQAGGDNETPSPFTSRKAVDRQFFGCSSGALAPSVYRPVSIAQAALHHSISDPCENPPTCTGSNRANGDHGWHYEPKQPQRNAGVRNGRGSTLQAPVPYKPARSDAALPSLIDAPSQYSSYELQGGSISGPAAVEGAARPLPHCSFPSVEGRAFARPAGPLAPSNPDASACSPVEMGPDPADSILLATCPSTPAVMRRKNWCLEDYEVSRKIYKGSTSAVYKATCRRSGLPVALKVYFLSRVPPNVVHMIVREIKIHVELVHKNIVTLYGAFQDEKRLVLVQEYAGRGDLYGIYRAMNRRMSEAQLTALVLAPFVDALAYLHARGICHRDIKPENILFTNDWRLVIADFGVSINLHQERAVTRAGTLEYMAPEVERCPLKMLPEENKDNDSIAYGTAVDVWATGVLAYELMVGFPPFVVDHSAGAGGNGISGAGGAFLAEHATRKTLSFPSSTTAGARDFISLALAERSEERPTALQLYRHPWLAAATQQPPLRRSTGQLTGISVVPLYPSRLGSSSLANNSGIKSASAAVL